MGKDKKSQEEIVATFNGMRGEQRQIASKTNELQQDLNEHNIVIETLQGVDADRKCFRMVGGVLVERTVQEVLPALVGNRDKMGKLIESLDKQLKEKGRRLMVIWRSTIFNWEISRLEPRKKRENPTQMLKVVEFWWQIKKLSNTSNDEL